MDKKYITFLIATDRKGVIRRFSFPTIWVKSFIVSGVILGVLTFLVLVDYMALRVQFVEDQGFRAENRQLKNQLGIVESKLSTLESGLERIRSFTKKLKLITHTEDPDRIAHLSISPDGHIDRVEDIKGSRHVASIIKKSDFVPPLDLKGGELVRQSQDSYSTLSIRIDEAIKNTQLREQEALQLWEELSSRQSLLAATPSIKPAKGNFTSHFGYRVSPFSKRATLHQGLDIAAPPGAPVYASAAGIVSYAGWDAGYGKLVSIDHGFGIVTRYGHNSKVFVVVGQEVKRGDVIAAVGNTGRSTGIHLHYEVRVNNVPVDPMNYILLSF